MKTLKNYGKKSEQLQDIVERMPTHFGKVAAIIVGSLTALLLLFGWLIEYPDSVTGGITINAKFAPVRLVANTSGRITRLLFKPKDSVKEGDYLAVIQNSANTDDMLVIKHLIDHMNINSNNVYQYYKNIPLHASLGDINIKYYAFVNATQQLYTYKENNIFQKQQQNLNDQIVILTRHLFNDFALSETKKDNMTISKKIYHRDSVLLSEKAISDDDADHTRINFLTSKENFELIRGDINSIQQQISDDKNKLQQIFVQQTEKEKQMHFDLLSSYAELRDDIKNWEQHFVLKSPMDGRVDFLQFWTNNQYVENGQQVFSIIPKEDKIVGEVQLPAYGAGKVKVGQNVIIKLDNYPFGEFGSVTGRVSSISLITNTVKMSNKDNLEAYLVTIFMPNGLTTNYGQKLEFKYEIKGTADIITKPRRLIQRLFDNLKEKTSKK